MDRRAGGCLTLMIALTQNALAASVQAPTAPAPAAGGIAAAASMAGAAMSQTLGSRLSFQLSLSPVLPGQFLLTPQAAPAAVAVSKAVPSAVSPLNGSVSKSAPAAIAVSKTVPSAVSPLNDSVSKPPSPEARRLQGTMRRVMELAAAQSLRAPGASVEDAFGHGKAFFDNSGRREAAVSLSAPAAAAVSRAPSLNPPSPAAAPGSLHAAAGQEDPAWEQSAFEGSHGARIAYKYRIPAGAEGKVPTIFVGGLALAESFEPYFQRHAPKAGQFTLWLRGLPPSEWTGPDRVFDADALDLARLIVLAGRKAGSDRVDLALHSYSTMLFQRLLGLREDPLVAEALRYLKGAKVTLFMGSTHHKGVEDDMDPISYLKLQLSRTFVDIVSFNDATRDAWRDLAAVNPLLLPGALAYSLVWDISRSLLLSSAGRDVGRDLKSHLQEPWAPDLEPLRRRLLELIDRNSERPGWQEAALKRFVDLLHLDFSPEDVKELRRMGVRLRTVAAVDDDILPWALQRHLLMRLGIDAPPRAPEPGTVLTDKEGRFRLTVVGSDHFYPLREPDGVRDILDGE